MTAQVIVAIVAVLVSAVGLVSGLVGAYVSLQNRALLAEVRAEMAEMENRIVGRINGSYVRTGICDARKEVTQSKLDALEKALRPLDP